jgi:hypothetical protein
MMAYKMPKDFTGAPIPVLSLKSGGGQKISFTGTSARNSTAFEPDTRNANKGGIVIGIYADQGCYIEIGDITVTANTTTSHYFPAGFYYDIALDNSQTHIAVISDGVDGTFYTSIKV